MRSSEDIRKAIRTSFIENFVLREAYGLDPTKSFEEQFSSASIEAQYTDIAASAIYNHEYTVNERADGIAAQIAAEYPFSLAWYYSKALDFQLGDALTFNEKTYRFSYPVVDPAKQIIRLVSVRQLIIDDVTKLRIYATKINKQPLTLSEKAAFEAYMHQIAAAGTHFDGVVSRSPDNLTLNCAVYYNPQILSNIGERLSGGGRPVDESVVSCLDNIKYSGAFNRTKIVDAIQAAEGVVDVVLNDVYMNNELNNAQSFESESGFFNAQAVNVTYIPRYEN
jgi:hypothetical protein